MFKTVRGQGGFTLLELAIVVVIIAILAAVVIPRTYSLASSARQAKANEVVSILNETARMKWGKDMLSGSFTTDTQFDNSSLAETIGATGLANDGACTVTTDPVVSVGENTIDCTSVTLVVDRTAASRNQPATYQLVSAQ